MRKSAAVLSLDELRPKFRSGRAEVSETDSNASRNWKRAEDKLSALCSLPIGWDGYRGRPIPYPNAYFALTMLRSIGIDDFDYVDFVPGSDGDLQIEWSLPDRDIEIRVVRPNQVIAWRSTEDPEGESVELKNDFSRIVPWFTELSLDAAG